MYFVLPKQVSIHTHIHSCMRCRECYKMLYIEGSGKTLAYLAPLISELRREEAEEGVVPRLGKPRALVVLPSRDLAYQVLVSVCLSL